MQIRFLTFEYIHNKKDVGSTTLRVKNLIKYWKQSFPEDDTGLYKHGEKSDVLVFQKVYSLPDFKFPNNMPGIKILDICDPDWLDFVYVRETINNMNAVTCPTEAIAGFLRQLTDKPIVVIPDRHDIEMLPKPKKHKGEAKRVGWFGYSTNAEILKHSLAVRAIEREGLELLVVSESDPHAYRWAENPEYIHKYKYEKFSWGTLYSHLQSCDMILFPKGIRPRDRFKSNNKTSLAWLLGIPVADSIDSIIRMKSPEERQKEADKNYEMAIEEYNVKKSVQDMKDLINDLAKK